MPPPSRPPRAAPAPPEGLDNPIERLQLLAGDDDAISAFLDDIDVRSPREREMLAELARSAVLARPERFVADHKRVLVAIESLRRHGHHGSRAAASLGPPRLLVRYLVELMARFLVVGHVKNVAVTMRNLYWLREMEAGEATPEFKLLRPARFDAQALTEIVRGREIGVPTVVLLLFIPAAASIWRLLSGYTYELWWVAALLGLAGVLIGLGISWLMLRGTALASRRIRLSLTPPLGDLWTTVGHCGSPPRDKSRSFALIGIVITIAVWIVLPLLVTLSLAS
jgi:hypothetical protein